MRYSSHSVGAHVYIIHRMTEQEPESAVAEIMRHAERIKAMYPGISAERQEDAFVVGVASEVANGPGYYVYAYPAWHTSEQRVPDLALDIYTDPGWPSTILVAQFDGSRYRSFEHVEGVEVDIAAVTQNAKKATELFEAYSRLPFRARTLVPATKVRDAVRSAEGIRDSLIRAGAEVALGLLGEGASHSLRAAQTFAFVRYVLEDIRASTTE